LSPTPGEDYEETIPGTAITFEMVWIEGFWIGRTEVTWDEYLLYCAFDRDEPDDGVDGVARPSKPLASHPYDRGWGTGQRPAVGMSWNAAKKYCRWLSAMTGETYRLPTEEEWELACGEAPASLEDAAWIAENAEGMTHEVGQRAPNEHGLHDMLGNVWEYCADPYSPSEPERAVLRGGSWQNGPSSVTPRRRLGFDNDWVLDDPTFPPGVWWVPEGSHIGMRIVRPGPTGG